MQINEESELDIQMPWQGTISCRWQHSERCWKNFRGTLTSIATYPAGQWWSYAGIAVVMFIAHCSDYATPAMPHILHRPREAICESFVKIVYYYRSLVSELLA